MADHETGETKNTISGGIQRVVLQGRDFRDVHIGDVAQMRAAPVALAQLPPLVTTFTGRDAELADITNLLNPASGAQTVVVSALAGLAGVGKTALAVEAGHYAREAGWFSGGVLFIDLHGYDDAPVLPGQALDALLRALGIAARHIPPDTEQRAALYRSALAEIRDPVLIIADNASSEVQVRPLLPGPGPHRVMATSRHTLAGLGARLLDVAVLDEEAAVTLLDAALREGRPGDDRIGADQVGAARLARICGGLPLALQITAASLKADRFKTASELADDLGDEVRRLGALQYDDGSGTSAPSVAAAFELSYRKLDEASARLFRLFPVNPGPDVSTAAAAILVALPLGEGRRTIGRLARAHLVEASRGATGRWRMHDLVGLYARQLSDVWAEADGREQARDRLLAYYLTNTQAADGHLRALPGMPVSVNFTSRDDALAWLDEERPNLMAAVTMAARAGRDESAMLLPISMTQYLAWRRRFDDLAASITITRDAARRLGNKRSEATALATLGNTLHETRQPEEAIIMHQEAAALFREAGDSHREGMTLNNLGTALRAAGRVEEAITACQQAAEIFRAINNQQYEGAALNNLSNALRAAGRVEEAITACQQAVEIFRAVKDRQNEGIALGSLGVALQEASRPDEAITAHRDAAAIFRETHDRRHEAEAMNNLGTTLRNAGQTQEAIAAHQAATAIYREIGDQHSEGMALDSLSSALHDAGLAEEAVTAHQAAVAILRKSNDSGAT